MQLRLWENAEELRETMDMLIDGFGDKIKIISRPYPSSSNDTQRIYIEVELKKDYQRKYPIDKIPTRAELLMK